MWQAGIVEDMKTKFCIGIILLAVSLSPAQTTNLTALLQQGLFEEQASRNLDAAITDYQTLAAQFDKDRQLAATAVFRLGECYRAQGRTNEAAAQYQRILRDFSDQSTLATLSQQDLTGMGMGKTDAAAPVPVVENADTQLLRKLEGKSRDELEKLLPTLMPNSTLDALIRERREAKIQRTKLLEDYTPESIQVARMDTELKELDQQIAETIAGMMQGLKLRAEISPPSAKRADLVDLSVPASSEEDQEITRIKQMIQNSPDLINAPGDRGFTPLTEAAAKGWLRVATYLMDHGADVNAGRIPPLNMAAIVGNRAMVELLLGRGADVNAKDSQGKTSLHSAAELKYPSVVAALLANKADANARDNNGTPPLFAAVQGGQLKIIQSLLAAGADANVRDDKGRTALNYAIKTSPELFKALLDAGTNPNTVDSDGRTPLSYAAERDGAEVVKLLLSAKADPNGDKIASPLVSAVNKTDLVSAEMLLQAGADPNAKGAVETSGGSYPPVTPLFLAISKGQHPMVQLLLKYKADPDGSQINGRPLLFTALSDTNINILESLLAGGANIESHDKTVNINGDRPNWTPLAAAVWQGQADTVNILLKHGADPKAKDAAGNQPLHWSVSFLKGQLSVQDVKIVGSLLDQGADPNVQNHIGYTPLDTVKQKLGRNEGQIDAAAAGKIVGLLRQHGALDNLPDFTRIRITRQGLAQPLEVFHVAAMLTNQFTLLETVMRFYSQSQGVLPGQAYQPAYQALPFPDLGRILIRRPGQKIGDKEQEIKVSLLNHSNVVDCAQDVPVEFGDVIEIPESIHALNADMPDPVREMEGRSASFAERLQAVQTGSAVIHNPYQASAQCLQKSVQLVVGGDSTSFKVSSWREGFLSEALNKTEARSILRTSSDLSRVKITRKTGKSARPVIYTVDLSQHDDAFWLQDGDLIEVPEKP